MLDTSQWPELHLNVIQDLHLDPRNVRLASTDETIEADIIEDLFANEDALSLVESICRLGYLTHETPVVLNRDGQCVVVEGNRRLAALKAIQNPFLVRNYQARIEGLVASLPNRSALSTIRVMVAPTQEAADQLIAAIHTGNLRKPWTPNRQAAFFQAQLRAGRSFSDLLERYPTIDVNKFVFRANMLNLFESVSYDDEELVTFLKTNLWARGLSTLARIYESKEFLELTGLKMQEDGTLAKRVSDPVFKEIATTIVRGMHGDNINTRSLNSVKSPRYIQLLKELREIVAESSSSILSDKAVSALSDSGAGAPQVPSHGASPGSDGSSSAISGPTLAVDASPTATTPPPPGRTRKPKNLDLSQVKAPDQYPQALKLLLGELSEIDVRKFPNATFLMIRSVLEKSIKSFAEANAIDIKGSGNNDNGYVQLRHALDWLLDYVKKDSPSHPLRQPIERVRTGKMMYYVNSSDSLNAVNHNHHFTVDADEAFSMWDSLHSIMRYLMKP